MRLFIVLCFLLGTSLSAYSSQDARRAYEKAWTHSVFADTAGIMTALTAGGGVYWGSKKVLRGISKANKWATPLKWTPIVLGISLAVALLVEGLAEDGIDYWYEQHLINKIERHLQMLESEHNDLIAKDIVGHIITLSVFQERSLFFDTFNSFKAIDHDADNTIEILTGLVYKHPQIISPYPDNYGLGRVRSYLAQLETLNVDETSLAPLKGHLSFRRSLKEIILKAVPEENFHSFSIPKE